VVEKASRVVREGDKETLGEMGGEVLIMELQVCGFEDSGNAMHTRLIVDKSSKSPGLSKLGLRVETMHRGRPGIPRLIISLYVESQDIAVQYAQSGPRTL
jgi:hypothetical protein